MAFEDITKGKWEKKGAVRDRVRLSGKRGMAIISISGDIVDRLGAPTFVRIGVGTGEHAGKILIREAGMKTQNTYRLSRPKKSSLGSVTLSTNKLRLKKFVDPVTRELDHSSTDDGLVVTVPNEMLA